MNILMKKPLELMSAITLIIWGVWVGCPFFDSFQVSNVFHMMEKVAPEWLWGTFILLLGITKLLIMNTKYMKLRIVVAVLIMLTFSILSVFYALGNWMSTAAPMYIAFTILSWFSYMEILYEKKVYPAVKV
jgi:hypothetical protein